MPNDFDLFWAAYPRKVGKAAAQKKWHQLNPPLDKALEALERDKRTEQWQRGIIPHAATWIHQRRWEDEGDGPSPQLIAKVGRWRKYGQVAEDEPFFLPLEQARDLLAAGWPLWTDREYGGTVAELQPHFEVGNEIVMVKRHVAKRLLEDALADVIE